jgi:hypothetical protein
MAFNPKQEYQIIPDSIGLRDFHEYSEDYITRPPYQRKSVWSVKKQQGLFDSFFRRYYVPRLVVREVRLSDEKTVREIIDGQQRITAIQDFFAGKFKLPESLRDIHPELAGKKFDELSTELRKFIDKELKVSADIVKNIDNPRDPEHQRVATEIFWRLQEGEPLNFMERAHAKLSSLSRNFIVKYSDDESFDYDKYVPVDENPHKHEFFKILGRNNERMQHLTTMARFLLIEEADGYADLKDSAVVEFIERYESPDGVGNYSFEETDFAKACLKNLGRFFAIFEGDPMYDENSGIKELSREYLVISLYFLIRHLRLNYVITEKEQELIRDFYHVFYQRWSAGDEEDVEIERFSNRRQQSRNDLQDRDIIFRQLFFEYLAEKGAELTTFDKQRAFNEAQKIRIYRRDNGMCQHCLNEGKPENEAQVSWSQYQADHILPFIKGGRTGEDNAQVLCTYHNAKKGAQTEARGNAGNLQFARRLGDQGILASSSSARADSPSDS